MQENKRPYHYLGPMTECLECVTSYPGEAWRVGSVPRSRHFGYSSPWCENIEESQIRNQATSKPDIKKMS